MISYLKKLTEQLFCDKVSCDVCHKVFDTSNDEDYYEIQEFQHINFVGGYGSIFGDCSQIEIDICQHCLKEKLGNYLRLKEDI